MNGRMYQQTSLNERKGSLGRETVGAKVLRLESGLVERQLSTPITWVIPVAPG